MKDAGPPIFQRRCDSALARCCGGEAGEPGVIRGLWFLYAVEKLFMIVLVLGFSVPIRVRPEEIGGRFQTKRRRSRFCVFKCKH